ncbi:TPA: hypothetical protein DCE37_23280 [Candidatus Latescibacteria bacterium]|nr:hypothetical protein [Candidatus Latescibacterota bacterium]|tara:strand:+ start:188 stop:370 length:183 start_codon:yes stop_codon:yes gene_type:complete
MATPRIDKLVSQNEQVSQATETEKEIAEAARLTINERNTEVRKANLNITQTAKALREAQA